MKLRLAVDGQAARGHVFPNRGAGADGCPSTHRDGRDQLHGRGAELRCIETRPAGKGETQRTLLAGAARDAAQVVDAAGLAALCMGRAGE